MFAIGQSHACAACITADEVHDQRHREIASLVNEYRTLFTTSDIGSTPTYRKMSITREPFQNIANIENDEWQDEIRQRNDMETNSTSSTSNENHHATPSKAEQRVYKKALKLEKAVKKSVRNSERHTLSIRQRDIDDVKKALHGDSMDTKTGSSHPLATDKDVEQVIERNRRFVTNIQQHKAYLRKTIRTARRATDKHRMSRKRVKALETDDSGLSDNGDSEAIVNAVVLQLGVKVENEKMDMSETFVSTSPAKVAVIVQKLKMAIQEDLDKHENEQRQTCIRAGGFWRYCGRPVFDRMTEIAKTIDWRTGRILKGDEKLDLPDVQEADIADVPEEE